MGSFSKAPVVGHGGTPALLAACWFVFGMVVAGFAGSEPETAGRADRLPRPLPLPSQRPMQEGPAYFVDAVRGDDRHDGSATAPWKSLAQAVKHLQAGDALYLRGGTYYQPLALRLSAAADRPIVVRSYPGELAVIDAGWREFFARPAEAWEPWTAPEAAPGEFRSTRTYADYAAGEARRDVYVTGNFGDSMVPLHGYRYRVDFRTANPCWNIGSNANTEAGVYVGPGLWYDPQTQRIHVRLSHLAHKAYGEDRYLGETDPRRLPLVIAGPKTALTIAGCRHLCIEDVVLRGSVGATVDISDSTDVTLDGVTIYGGSPAVCVEQTTRLRIRRCAVRGLSAPWSSRASHKYRGKSPYLLTCGRGNRDFEFACNEFTDSHDGLTIGTVVNMDFHHNLVENFDDDAIYLNSLGSGGNIRIYQNVVKRVLSTFSFSGDTPTGQGVFIYRNLFDLRRYNYGSPPPQPDSTALYLRPGRVWGDHGSPTWEPMTIYHNTVIRPEEEFRAYYGAGWGGHTARTRRRIFNNIFVHLRDVPGLKFASTEDDLQADGNLHWSLSDGPTVREDFFAAFRQSPVFAASRKQYAPGWAAADRFADPQFHRLGEDWRVEADVRLLPGSPAVDAGVALPAQWPDPLRAKDRGKPDIGALPLGAEPLQVGPSAWPDRPTKPETQRGPTHP